MTRARGRAPYCERGKRGKKKVREEEEGREREGEKGGVSNEPAVRNRQRRGNPLQPDPE